MLKFTMSSSRGFDGWLLLLLTVDMASLLALMLSNHVDAWIPTNDDESMSCLEGRIRCEADVTCRVLSDTINKVCDKSGKCHPSPTVLNVTCRVHCLTRLNPHHCCFEIRSTCYALRAIVRQNRDKLSSSALSWIYKLNGKAVVKTYL